MIASARSNRFGTIIGAIFLLAVFIGMHTATAQVVFTRDHCGEFGSIVNNTNCKAILNFDSNPAWNLLIAEPQAATLVRLPDVAVLISGIFSNNGTSYPIIPPLPPGAGCGQSEWWIPNVMLGPPPGCCFDICIEPCNCTVTLNAAADPPPCRP